MVSLIFIALIFFYVQYQSYHYDNIFQIPIYVILGVLWIVIFRKKYKFRSVNNLSKENLILAAIFSLLINLVVVVYYEAKRNSPTLIKAQIFGGYTDFKKNGQYVIVSGSWGSRTHFYGEYKLKDSIITTDRKTFDDVLTSNRFLIKSTPKNVNNTNSLIQIDNAGNEIQRKYNTKNHRLKIIEDNRLNGR